MDEFTTHHTDGPCFTPISAFHLLRRTHDSRPAQAGVKPTNGIPRAWFALWLGRGIATCLVSVSMLLGGVVGPPDAAAVIFSSGTHTVNSTLSDLYATGTAIVEVVDPAVIGSAVGDLTVDGHAVVDITGGTIQSLLQTFQDSTVTISGGTIDAWVTTWGNTTMSITGGSFPNMNGVDLLGDSTASISGGTFVSSVAAWGFSNVGISGGTFNHAWAVDSSTMNISGGTFAGTVFSGDNAVLNILGFGFNLPFGAVEDINGTLIGTLADGSEINFGFGRDQGFDGVGPFGTINLIQVPEPMSLMLVFIGGLMLRRRRKAPEVYRSDPRNWSS